MTEKESNTEQKILDAAKDVFQKKGMTGARMQEIADRAGINKALLHYYYRTKEKLFEKVFEAAFYLFYPKIRKMFISDKTVFEKIEFFIHSYIGVLRNHPYIPGFIINEINRNPQILVKIFEKNIEFKTDNVLDVFQKQIDGEAEKGIIRSIDVKSLMVNIIGLCVFPIVARPIIQGVLFDSNKKEYDNFISQREVLVTEFVINSIRVNTVHNS